MSSRLVPRGVFLAAVAVGVTAVCDPASYAQRFSEWSSPENLGSQINTASFEG